MFNEQNQPSNVVDPYDKIDQKPQPLDNPMQQRVMPPIEPSKSIESTTMAPSPKKKTGLLILIIVLAALIVAGAAFGAYYFYFKTDPAKLLSQSYEKMLGIASGRVAFDINANFKDKPDQKVHINVVSDINNDNYQAVLKIDTQLLLGEVALPLSMEIDLRKVDEEYFFRIPQLPAIPFLPIEGATIKDQWFKLDKPDSELYNGWQQQLGDYQAQMTELVEQIKKAVADNQVFVLQSQTPVKVNGFSAYQYEFVVGQENLLKAIEQVALAMGASAEDIESARENFNLSNIRVGLLIDVKTGFWKSMIINFDAQAPDYVNTSVKQALAVNMQVDFINLGLPMEIVKPQGAISADELVGKVLGAKGEPTDELSIDSDADKVVDYDESFWYGTDPKNPDSDNDGYSDYDEIKSGYNPLGEGKAEGKKVLVYFGNSKKNPTSMDCGLVYPVEVTNYKFPNVMFETMTYLVSGIEKRFEDEGYYNSIPEQVFIKSLKMSNGRVYIDFTGNMNQTGGSCKISAIRAQIERTLMQFPGVESVVISVEGDVAGALQP